MSSENLAISVRGLTKEYRIQHQEDKVSTMAEAITRRVRNPARKSSVEIFRALDDVTFDVERGEVLGIIGRNGAGKSTLLKVLSRITEPTKGEVRMRGRVASLLEVGTGFHPELTGRENIYLNGAILGMPRRQIKRQFDEIVDFAETEKFLDTPVKRYSSGMYVRLAFAVAAHLDPEILIVDEVLSVGDASFQKKCLGKLQDVSGQEGRTVLFVSHNMSAIAKLCSRSVLLKQGRVIVDGTTTEAIEAYENRSLVALEEYTPEHFVGRISDLDACLGFRSVWFDKQGPPEFDAGTDITFYAKLLADQDIPAFRISLTIFSADGSPVGTVFGPNSLSINAGRETTFKVRIPDTRLAPGKYWINLAVGSGDFVTGLRDHEIIQEVLHFDVLDVPGDGGTFTNWNANWGRTMLPGLLYDAAQRERLTERVGPADTDLERT